MSQIDTAVFVFGNSKYLVPDETNPLLTQDFMENTIYPKSDSLLHNSMLLIEKFDGCQRKNFKSLKDLIVIIDLNNDGFDDIVVDSFCWGLNCYNSRIIFNDNGNYDKRITVNGVVSNVAIENGKILGYYNTIPPCCNYPFWRVYYNEFNTNFETEQKYAVEYCVNFKKKDINNFISEKVRIGSDTICIASNYESFNDTTANELPDGGISCVQLKSKTATLLYKTENYGIVIIQNSKEFYEIKPEDNTYICGWIRLSDLEK